MNIAKGRPYTEEEKLAELEKFDKHNSPKKRHKPTNYTPPKKKRK